MPPPRNIYSRQARRRLRKLTDELEQNLYSADDTKRTTKQSRVTNGGEVGRHVVGISRGYSAKRLTSQTEKVASDYRHAAKQGAYGKQTNETEGNLYHAAADPQRPDIG